MDEERVTVRQERVDTPVAPPGYVPPPPGYVAPARATYTESAVTYRPSRASMVWRLIIFLFGLVQGLILLRIVLLLVAAREGNDLVQLVYGVSEIFVAPFRGILRIDEVAAGRSALDVGAIVALVGWTLIELIVLALLRVFRREP